MAKLLNPIPPQAFEVVRDKTVDILAEELATQLVINPVFIALFPAIPGINIFSERSVALDKTEMPAVNVILFEGDYDNEDINHSDGSYVLAIDCYTSSESVGTGSNDIVLGDKLAKIKLHKLIGAIRAILKAPVYNTLGFERPFIIRVRVGRFSFAEATEQDGMHTAYGRLLFHVRVPENVELQEPRVMNGYETKYKIADSEKGFITIGGI
jgi:hypothetical protein